MARQYRPPARPEKGEADALVYEIHQRMIRACEVAQDYEFEDCGSGTWFVSVPGEDDRSYVVQLGKNECSCPDFTMNPDIPICKHLHGLKIHIGLEPGKVNALRLPTSKRPVDYASWFVSIKDADADGQDPYERI